jgi:hypothetical protein
LTLACRLQYWIPASAPFTYTYSASGWQPISGPQDDFGGDSPDQAPPGWPNAYALSGNLPAGWRQGAHVVISDSGTPPPQAQGEAKVTVAFQDPNAKTVYTTSVDVNLGSAQGDVSQFPIEFNVSAGLSATGANACTATAST